MMNDELKRSDIEFSSFDLGARSPNPNKPKGPKAFCVNRLVQKWQEQTQKTYQPCYQVVAMSLTPLTGNLAEIASAPSRQQK